MSSKQSQASGIIVEPEYRGRNLVAVVDEVKADLPLLREIISLKSWGDLVHGSSEFAALPRIEPGDIAANSIHIRHHRLPQRRAPNSSWVGKQWANYWRASYRCA